MEPSGAVADEAIVEAVAGQEAWTCDLLRRLVAAPTTLGNEETGKRIVESTLREIGLSPVDVPMDADALRAHPQAAPFDWDVAGKRIFGNVAGIPAVCFGPFSEHTHGIGERVYLPSVIQTAQVLGLFIRDWCGLV